MSVLVLDVLDFEKTSVVDDDVVSDEDIVVVDDDTGWKTTTVYA